MDDNNPHIGTLLLVVGGIVTGRPEVWIPAAGFHLAKIMEIDKAAQVYFDESPMVRKLTGAVKKQLPAQTPESPKAESRQQMRIVKQDKPRFRPTYSQPTNGKIPNLIEDLASDYHLQFIGHTGGGKTTLIHALATMKWNVDGEVIVLDPKFKPGYWPGCLATGLQNDYEDMRLLANSAWCELQRRYEWFNAGYNTDQLEPLTIIVDEYDKIVNEVNLVDRIFEEALRRGRELKVRFVMGVQDTQAGTINAHGRTHLFRNFTHIISCHYNEFDGSRYVEITDGKGENKTKRSAPTLPDFHLLGASRDMSELRLPPLRDRLVLNTANTAKIEQNTSIEPVSTNDIPVPVPDTIRTQEDYLIYCWLSEGKSGNWIYEQLKGNRNEVLEQIRKIRTDYFEDGENNER